MLGFPFFFSVAYLLLLGILPESPRWLSARGKAGRARQVASKLNLEAGEMTVSDTNIQEGRDRIKVTELFKGNLAKVVFIGSILAALQQIHHSHQDRLHKGNIPGNTCHLEDGRCIIDDDVNTRDLL